MLQRRLVNGLLVLWVTCLGSVWAKEVDSTHTQNTLAMTSPLKVPTLTVSPAKIIPKLSEKRFKQLNNAGIQQAYQRRYYGAFSLLQQARESVPHNDTLLYNLALVNGLLKNYDAALEIMTQTGIGQRYLHNKGVWEARKGEIRQSLTTWGFAHPTDTLCFNVALANYQLGELKEAQDWGKRVGFAKAAEFHELSANVLFRLGEYKQAEKFYEKAEKFAIRTGKHASGPRLLVQRGNVHLAQNEYEKAELLYREYLGTKDGYYRYAARLGLGHALYRQRKYQEAVLEYDAACRLSDESAEAWLSLGNAYVGTNGHRQAQKAYERALDLDSTQKTAWLGLGMVYYRLRNFSEAVCCFDQAGEILSNKNRQHADFFAARAFCRLYTNQTPLAKDDVQTAVRLAGKGLLPCLAMSEYCRIEGYFLTSLKWLERAMRANEEASVRMLVNRGNIYLKCREYEDAMNDFSEAHRLDPSNINASNGLGVSLLNMDEIDRAKVLYDSLLRKKSLAILYNNRGIVQSYLSLRERHQKNYKEEEKFSTLSMQDFEKGLEVDSTKKAYHVNIGNVYKNRNEETPAIEHYQLYLSKNAINNMGVLFGKDTRKDFSKHYLDIAISYDTANTIYLYNRAKLFHDHFKDQFFRRKDVQQAFKLAPTKDISLKYSPDGFITIFLFDYDFETYHFPGDPLFDVQPQPIDDFVFLPSLDFIPMPGGGDVFAKNGKGGYLVTKNQLRFRPASRSSRGKTKCPKI
jgi:tetratricopeptide (TPR) repeat protein